MVQDIRHVATLFWHAFQRVVGKPPVTDEKTRYLILLANAQVGTTAHDVMGDPKVKCPQGFSPTIGCSLKSCSCNGHSTDNVKLLFTVRCRNENHLPSQSDMCRLSLETPKVGLLIG